ncbi:MAG: lipopolysaccharide transport periplasmic protein LptA [Candidatus Accumulibacter sp.]|jgi:lipopolysaccharide export system protein LptA|nr:lipopolysaccharide transport periplasmic protein LptA [Accumulibacter sp.]
MRLRALVTLAIPIIALCAARVALAEKADRDRPVSIEANRMSLDDLHKIQIYEGNVVLTQGTTQLRANHLVVTQDADGFQKSVATGGENGLAHFKEKLDGKDGYMEGRGERIEYNARDEKAEFFVRAWVKNGADEVWGQYIFYDALTEKFLATNERKGREAAPQGRSNERVRAIIMPKEKKAETTEATASTSPTSAPDGAPALKPSETVTPRQE